MLTERLATAPGMAWYALRADGRAMMPQTTDRHTQPGVRLQPSDLAFPVQRVLERHGYRCYVPSETWSRRANRFTHRRVYTMRALIAGLVLVELPDDPEAVDWYRLMRVAYMRGVYCVLRPLRPQESDGLAAMEAEAEAQPGDPFAIRPGGKAVAVHGPMAGQVLDVVDVLTETPEPVAEALVSLFGGKVRIQIPLADMRAAPREERS